MWHGTPSPLAAVARNDLGAEPQLIWAATGWNERVAKLWQLRDPPFWALFPAHTSGVGMLLGVFPACAVDRPLSYVCRESLTRSPHEADGQARNVQVCGHQRGSV